MMNSLGWIGTHYLDQQYRSGQVQRVLALGRGRLCGLGDQAVKNVFQGTQHGQDVRSTEWDGPRVSAIGSLRLCEFL